jgi:hypothetical protein
MDIEKLEKIFKIKYSDLARDAKDPEFFVNYCDEHKIVMVHSEWVKETFNERRRGVVCIDSPECTIDSCTWLLVPRKFAERALVLGCLP